MSNHLIELQHLLTEMAALIEQQEDPDPQLYQMFFHNPTLAFNLIDLIENLDEDVDENLSVYSACVFALDICVAHIQAAVEIGNKQSIKMMDSLMYHLAMQINLQKHSISFWLPILNSFYAAQVELNESLKDAFIDLAGQEEDRLTDVEPISHLDAIRDLIKELSDLSVFELAESFFAQSYAMPPDFFAELIVDLYNIKEGEEVALLILLHPKAEVREIVITTLDQIMDQLTLSSISLTRLQAIMYWYPEQYHPYFKRWIKTQRKKGVVFAPEAEPVKTEIKATEVDGSGAQGIFIHVRENRKNRLCGLLLKYNVGLKDVWITPNMSSKDVADYYKQSFDENITLRDVDLSYFVLMVEHFLALGIERGEVPSLHFLEIQELLALRLRPRKLDLDDLFTQLSVQITPFTPDAISDSLQRSKSWLKNKSFTESWYEENPLVDKIVNHNSSFIKGIRVCDLEKAMSEVFSEEMEHHRERWQFHFLWLALWMKAKEKKNEKIWRDSFLIAYTIHEGTPLDQIPVMQEICRQTVINSVETMQDRRTHLSQE